MADHAEGTHGHNMSMGTQARLAMLRTHHRQTLWVYWSIVMLGAWLVCAPWTFGYGHTLVVPTDGRDVWLSLEARAAAMRVSDLLSGLALLFFGWRALRPNRPAGLWICCLVGIWLSLAPVVFWAPTPVAYLNDTLVGMAVIALSILIPGMPNMIMYMKMGPATPPGWSYNPSSWPQRWIIIALGFLGLVTSRYLAAYQLGYIPHAMDPFFGDGAEQVLGSQTSRALPVSDAALGTCSVVAVGEVFRLVRAANVPLGLALVAAPWSVGGGTATSSAIGVVVGLAIAGLAIPRGPKRERYGGWDRLVR